MSSRPDHASSVPTVTDEGHGGAGSPPPLTSGAEPSPLAAKDKPRSRGAVWREELAGLCILMFAVIAIHSLIAKPFYIPSESMMPGLIKGDRLIVTKYPYGWSYVSPSLPNPVGIFRSVILREPGQSWGIALPFAPGRIWGRVPERGDIVIVTHPGTGEDYIKRVIGLPGDRIEIRGGRVSINGVAVQRQVLGERPMPIDPNLECPPTIYAISDQRDAEGRMLCLLPVVRETLPNGRSFDTIDLGYDPHVDDYGPIKIPSDHVFLMGDNRDQSADSRVALEENGLGGPVPIENIGGRAEFITFSVDGSERLWNPLSWWSALRPHRWGLSLRPDIDQSPAP